MGRTGMVASVLGFGSAEIGFGRTDPSVVERLLGSALDAGLNVIDTAECYAVAEESIGQTMAHRRDEYLLFTKVGHTSGLQGEDWEPGMMRESIDRSLARLKTDRVDLIQLHSCSREKLEQGEVVEVLQRAREQGKTRFIGYSGDNDAAEYAVACGAFDTLQTSISVADQRGITRQVAAAARADMGIIAKRPVANAAWRQGRRPDSEYAHLYWDRLEELAYPFLQGDLSAAIGHALRFTLSVPGVHTAIVGTTQPERWQSNAKLLEGGLLSTSDYAAIRARWNQVAGEDWLGDV